MKKIQDEVVLNDVYHTIKSPIVSIKSLLFVLGRNKDVQGNQVLRDKISQIEDKINLLHQRSEIFLNYILFKEGEIEFLYSFFNLDEAIHFVIEKLNKKESPVRFSFAHPAKLPIMADHDQIQEALRIIFTRAQSLSRSGIISIMISQSGNMIDIVFKYKKLSHESKKKFLNQDEESIARQLHYIAGRIIGMHGGRVIYNSSGEEMKVKISLPTKAKTARVK